MSSLRFEIERLMGLKFPEKNGETLIQFNESLEVPQPAEELMRGYYRDPDKVRKGFHNLHQETAAILDMLLPKRVKLREWANELPDRPKEAERFLRETAEQMDKQERKRQFIEKELLNDLTENTIDDIFPLPIAAFGILSYQEPAVKIYLKPIGRTAEMLGLNPDQLRQAIRIHFLFLLLLASGSDLDGKGYVKKDDEEVAHKITTAYTMRYLQFQSKELANCYMEWLKTWEGKPICPELDNSACLEKLRAAMVFWRREPALRWEECWAWVEQIEKPQYLKTETMYLTRANAKKFFE